MLRLALLTLSVCLAAAPCAVPQDDGDAGNLVTLNVQSTPLGKVLEMISVRHRVNIVTAVDTKMSVTANFYDASLEEAMDWVLHPLGLGWVFDSKVYHVLPLSELEAIESPVVRHLVQPNYRTAAELQAFILPLLSAQGSIVVSQPPETGIPSSGEEAGGDSPTSVDTLLVTDMQVVIDEVINLVATLDVRPRQVLVKATMIEVHLDETNKFGVDLNILAGGPDFSDFGSLGDLDSVYTGGVPQPPGMLSAGTDGFTFPTSSDGVRFGYVGSGVSLFIEALQSIADTNVLANTEVLALNKQRGEIIIGGRLGYLGQTTVSDGISQQQVEFLEVGTQLRFRPFIGDDGFVRLEIHPQRSDGIVDPLTGLPSEDTSEVTTNVMVRDGETVVIGGLIETKEVSIQKKVPVLGHIPGLSWLFSSEETRIERSEIIILLTPHVLEDGEVHEDGKLIIEEYERDGEHFRTSFGPVARHNNAERVIDEARAALAKGRLHEARALCDRALQINPLGEGVVDLSVEVDRAIAEGGEGHR